MSLKELNDLIERFGDVQLLEIKKELQKILRDRKSVV